MSALRLSNQTSYAAYFVLARGQQIIARIPNVAAGASVEVPTQVSFEVSATTLLEGHTQTTPSHTINGSAGFLAQVRQVPQHGGFEFELLEVPATRPDQLQFQKTTLAPVSFNISSEHTFLQTVVVVDSFMLTTLQIADTYSIYAVINGVTTEVVTTTNPGVSITAQDDTSPGYYHLQINE